MSAGGEAGHRGGSRFPECGKVPALASPNLPRPACYIAANAGLTRFPPGGMPRAAMGAHAAILGRPLGEKTLSQVPPAF